MQYGTLGYSCRFLEVVLLVNVMYCMGFTNFSVLLVLLLFYGESHIFKILGNTSHPP